MNGEHLMPNMYPARIFAMITIQTSFSVPHGVLLGFAIGVGLCGANDPAASRLGQGTVECRTNVRIEVRANEVVEFDFCLHRTRQTDAPGLLLFLHGAMQDCHVWERSSSLRLRRRINQLKSMLGNKAPNVLVISFGPLWLLTPEDHRTHFPKGASVANVFEIIDWVERMYDIRGPRRLVGLSQGGFNAIQLLSHAPKGYWDRAVLISSLIPRFAPYEPGLSSALSPVNCLIRANFPNENLWARADPLRLAEDKLGPDSPPLLITAGKRDGFLFFRGNHELAQIATERGTRVTWLPHTLGHIYFDVERIHRFLTESPD